MTRLSGRQYASIASGAECMALVLHVVADLTSRDTTWEDVLRKKEYLQCTWEEGKFLGAHLHDSMPLAAPPFRCHATFVVDKHTNVGKGGVGSPFASVWCRQSQAAYSVALRMRINRDVHHCTGAPVVLTKQPVCPAVQ
jgi:hypothetical protein